MGPDDRKKPDSVPAPDGDWTKEQPAKGRSFDFDAFLGARELEDRLTDALDGKDAPAGGSQRAPANAPRRSGPDRGRHEAPGPEPEPEPGPEPEPEFPGDPPTQRFSSENDPPMQSFTKEGGTMPPRQNQPRPGQQPPRKNQPPRPQRPANEPPPRPKVIVAEPTPRVVVTPESHYPDAGQERKGLGKGMKMLIALLLSLAVVLAVVVLASTLLTGNGNAPAAGPTPRPTDYLFGDMPTQPPVDPTDVPPATEPPVTATPIPTPPPVTYHTVSVTAGPGGSVSPNGMVEVEDGGSATFTITPDWGYTLGQLLIDGSNVSVTDSYTFSDVRQDHTIYAVFQQAPPTEPPATDVPAPTDMPVIPEIPIVPEEPDMPDVPPAVEG